MLARSVKKEATSYAATCVLPLTTSASANQCLGIHRDCQDDTWYCPPCQKEARLKERASIENWPAEKLKSALLYLEKQRETFALPKREYVDPVPMLRQITDFNTSSSGDDEQEIDEGTITRIGPQFQVSIPEYGRLSLKNAECRKIWDSRKLSNSQVEDYLLEAKRLWEVSYLNSLLPYNEQDACKILHIKKYNVQNALQAIVHERLPYIVCKKYVVTEHDKLRQEQDIMELRSGFSLSMD